jgi:protein-tyrosine phosphatase
MKPEIYWIDGPWKGRLAIVGRPRGNDWLEDEVRAWKASEIEAVVSLLTTDEEAELGLESEKQLSKAAGIHYTSYPVPDRSVPQDYGESVRLIREVEEWLTEGKNVALHCRQGIGRSALLAACLLVSAGLQPDAAFARLREARGCSVPETEEQRQWVMRFSREIAHA